MFKDKANSFLSNLVEIDETYVGGKWENMSKKRRAIMQQNQVDNKTPVMGLVERDGKAKLKVIGRKSFKKIVIENVSKEAILITDAHQGYKGLEKKYAGHETVNHSENEFVRGIYYTNSVEGFFSIFKRMIIGIYHHISEKHLQKYCEEVTYRFNSRKIKDVDRFVNTFKNIQGRLTYKQLIGEGRKPKTKGIEFINGE